MSIATDLLLDIASGKNNYKIGEPWRFSEFSLVAVIPITRVVETPRAYRLLSEVKDEVHIKDTGSINQLEIENRYELPVLIKTGEIVSGSTQERTVAMSQFILSGEKVVIPCVCVHSTRGIRAGQQVKPDGFVPTAVRRTVYRTAHVPTWGAGHSYQQADQSAVWGSINRFSSSMCMSSERCTSYLASMQPQDGEPLHIPTGWQTSSDDLAGRLRESTKKFEAAIKQVPKIDNQVGFCLVNLDGFDTLDVFNHPESWEAIRKEILKSEASVIADVHKDNPFQYLPERAKAILIGLLNSKFNENIVLQKEQVSTTILENEKLKGEVVTLYGQPIHLSLLRKD